MNEDQNIDDNNEEELKETFQEMNENSDNIHIHKTGDDGTEVDIDVDIWTWEIMEQFITDNNLS